MLRKRFAKITALLIFIIASSLSYSAGGTLGTPIKTTSTQSSYEESALHINNSSRKPPDTINTNEGSVVTNVVTSKSDSEVLLGKKSSSVPTATVASTKPKTTTASPITATAPSVSKPSSTTPSASTAANAATSTNSQAAGSTVTSDSQTSTGTQTTANSPSVPDTQTAGSSSSTAVSQPAQQTASVPIPSFTHKKVLAYSVYYYNGDRSSYDSLVDNYRSMGELATQTFTVDRLGSLSGLVPSSQLSYAKSEGIRTYTMITNNFDPSIAKTLLESPTNRANLIANIQSKLKAYGYNGINVDLEGIYSYDRPYLSAFMKELYSALKPAGYAVTMSVPAETYDNPGNSWNGAFNYTELNKYTDEIILMTYDESFDNPGPIASLNWVKKVVSYALTVIPSSKIKLGTAAYGYDWSSKGRKALSIDGAYNLAAKYGVDVIWDSASATPHFDYVDSDGVSHSVWFEDSRSLSYKLDIVNSKNLSGIAIWRIGLENADYWKVINEKIY